MELCPASHPQTSDECTIIPGMEVELVCGLETPGACRDASPADACDFLCTVTVDAPSNQTGNWWACASPNSGLNSQYCRSHSQEIKYDSSTGQTTPVSFEIPKVEVPCGGVQTVNVFLFKLDLNGDIDQSSVCTEKFALTCGNCES